MNKNKAYELFYELIRDSMEQAEDADNYWKYVDGAVDMTHKIIDCLDNKECKNEIFKHISDELRKCLQRSQKS